MFKSYSFEENPAIYEAETPKCINWGSHIKRTFNALKSYVEKEKFTVAHAKHVGVIENIFVVYEDNEVTGHVNADFLEGDEYKELNVGLPNLHMEKMRRPTVLKMRSTHPITREVHTYTYTGITAALVWDAFQLNEGL